jgi:lipoprotein
MNEMSTKMKKAILIIINILTLSSCGVLFDDPIERFWNGDYSVRNNAAEFYKERRIFYENESQETKLLRVKNEQHCNKINKSLFYEKKHKYGDTYRVNMSDIFVHCMRVNGTPLYKDFPKKYEWLTDEDVRVK